MFILPLYGLFFWISIILFCLIFGFQFMAIGWKGRVNLSDSILTQMFFIGLGNMTYYMNITFPLAIIGNFMQKKRSEINLTESICVLILFVVYGLIYLVINIKINQKLNRIQKIEKFIELFTKIYNSKTEIYAKEYKLFVFNKLNISRKNKKSIYELKRIFENSDKFFSLAENLFINQSDIDTDKEEYMHQLKLLFFEKLTLKQFLVYNYILNLKKEWDSGKICKKDVDKLLVRLSANLENEKKSYKDINPKNLLLIFFETNFYDPVYNNRIFRFEIKHYNKKNTQQEPIINYYEHFTLSHKMNPLYTIYDEKTTEDELLKRVK